ncbi:MAG TPA: formyltransferase family protein [Thermoanaerobaculia bacterium]|nr:formyltransferase family protein [Thermoanaerobaculia bacterium]
MRVLYFGNNRLGWRVASWLRGRGVEFAGLVVHPRSRGRLVDEIIETAGLPAERVFDGSRVRDREFASGLQDLRADIGVSVSFGYILPHDVWTAFPAGCVNLHTGYLPYNRGAYPNVWSIVDRTPAGVTLHYVDDGIDTGDVIAQEPVPVEPIDTAASLFTRLEDAAARLFEETWPRLEAGTAGRRRQEPGSGSSHRVSDVANIDQIDLERRYRARDLLDLLRARSFPPHPGAYFLEGGRRVGLTLQLQYEEPAGASPEPVRPARPGKESA